MYEGILDGSKVCVKHVRVYTQDRLQKATQVHLDTLAFPVRLH